jgi:SAM-dependent methyltransferase
MNDLHAYELDPSIAEIYDQSETYDDDVTLLRRLIGARQGLRILEPFCGTGRMLLPLAADGHTLVGLDRAAAMLARARAKLAELPPAAQGRVTLTQADVLHAAWPTGHDLVILGGNCLYELATVEEQAACIARAAGALLPGGHLYLDNNHMEGELDPAWRNPVAGPAFPRGVCADGTRVEATSRTVWYDAPRRLARFCREIEITRPDGAPLRKILCEQKHPPSYDEMAGWLAANGFRMRATYGARDGRPYTPDAPRAIFWAQKV